MALKNLLLALFMLGISTPITNGDALLTGQGDRVLAPWLFHPGDNPQWKQSRLDETQWRGIEVPGCWRRQGFDSASGIGWYRAHIHIGAPADDGGALGVLLGRIFNADQTFFNGVPIGSEGRLGEQVVEAHYKTRAYRIPPDAVRHGEDNVLAVRVIHTRYAAGLVTGPIRVGDYAMLSMEAEATDSNIKVFQGMVLGLFLVILLFSCSLYLNGLRDKNNLYFSLLLVAISVVTCLDSLFFYDLGLKTPAVQRLIYALYCLVPILLMLFVVTFVQGRLLVWEKLIITVMACLAVLFLVPPSNLDTVLPGLTLDQTGLIKTSGAGALMLELFMIGRGLWAAHRGLKGGIMIAVAASMPLIYGLLSQQPQFIAGADPVLIGSMLMTLLFLFALARRHLDMTQRLQALTQHMTNIQAMERQRLSRDLHDSLGQNLASFQLNLKMANKDLKHPLLTGMLSEVSSSIKCLDDTLQGLRLTELAHGTLCTAIERHCRQVQSNTGLDIQLRTHCPGPMSAKLKENLFRIFQEALNNCVKYARAGRVKVEVCKHGNHLELKVADDGEGFDPKLLPNDGLGMLTMRERTHLIGGQLDVNSGPGNGTTVRVEVPLYD